jgi:hypothetical protein
VFPRSLVGTLLCVVGVTTIDLLACGTTLVHSVDLATAADVPVQGLIFI